MAESIDDERIEVPYTEDLSDWFDKNIDVFWTMMETELSSLLSMGLKLKDLSTATTVGGSVVEILYKGIPIRRFRMTYVDDGR